MADPADAWGDDGYSSASQYYSVAAWREFVDEYRQEECQVDRGFASIDLVP